MGEFRPSAEGEHGREEELQWARLLSHGDAACGVALVFVQKLCTAFHEFAPAWERGALSAGHLAYFRSRLAGRAARALETLRSNGLDAIEGAAQLEATLRAIEAAATMAELAALAEQVHAVGHTLSGALEREAGARAAPEG